MKIHFYTIGRTHHLKTVLEELKKQNAINSYEIYENRHEVKFEPFNAQSIFKIGVLLGQLPEVKDLVIGNFKKHRNRINPT